MGVMVAPLPGWNVRGYSYGELTPTGERHPGLDLNVGYGDDDLGLPVVAILDGEVVARKEWDGETYGLGSMVLVEHNLLPEQRGGLALWSLYAHLDELDEAARVGERMEAGQRLGACGKSGNQAWAHLHFEVRRKGPPRMAMEFWGGRLNPEAQAALYVDPYTMLCVLEGVDLSLGSGEMLAKGAEEELAALRADRDFNYALKMRMEGYIRSVEGKRPRVLPGTADRLIAAAHG